MAELFDPLIIIPAIVAIVVIVRLIGVLGHKTGNEQPPAPPFGRRPAEDAARTDDPARSEDNVVPLRPVPPADDPSVPPPADESALDRALRQIVSSDRDFDKGEFIDGARAAYEMIVTAFSQGDRKTLKSLLSREVFDGFAQAIDERARLGHVVETTFVGIDSADIVEAEVQNRVARIKVRFVSQLVTVTRDKDGATVDGDAAKVITVTDGWTFERPLTSSDPNWFLVATETLE